MNSVDPTLILYPVFAMFVLVAVVLGRMARLRFAAVGRQEMSGAYYRTFQGGEEPEAIRVVTRNFINLFEVPVLFYVVVIMTYVTGQASYAMVAMAWLYVGLRYVHTYVHLTSNDVLRRFKIYFASGLVLVAMWLVLFVELLIRA